MYKYKRYSVRIGNVQKTTARHIANEIRAQIIRGEYIPEKEQRVTFREATERYLTWHKNKAPSEKARKEVALKVRILNDYFGDYLLRNITYFTIEHYKKKRLEDGVSKATINFELNILKSIFNRAKEFGLFSGELPKIEKFKNADNQRMRALTEEEAQRLIDACPEWFKPVVIFALNTGFRASEIFSLKWEDIDLQKRVIYIKPAYSKTKKHRQFPMNEVVYNLLKNMKKRSEYVFVNSHGEPYNAKEGGYRRVFQTACKKAGIEDFRFHDLRHTFATWTAMKSKDIYAVQLLLGHSSQKMTQRYAHLTDEYLRSIVNFARFSPEKETG